MLYILHDGIGSLCLEGTCLEYVVDPRHALDGLWSPHSWSVGLLTWQCLNDGIYTVMVP